VALRQSAPAELLARRVTSWFG